MKINIKKISELTGYSTSTVSNALSGKRNVSKEAAAQIYKVAKECGFYDNLHIKKIKFVNFKNEGIVCADNTPFFSAVIDGVVSECQNMGYEMTLCTLFKHQADYQSSVSQILKNSNCAIIILATEMSEEDAAPFKAFSGPLVMLDCGLKNTEFNSVVHSNTDSFIQATQYLIQCSHKEIGYLASNIRIQNFLDRQLGYEIALLKNKLPIKSDYTFFLSPTLEASCCDMNELLDKVVKLPTAFVADNDNIALGALKALQQHGYRVPEDISIIGYDDISFSTISSPPLTTIRVYKEELGKTAVRKIAELINHPMSARTTIQLCDVLIERNSVMKI